MKTFVVVVLAVAFLAFMSVGEQPRDVRTGIAWAAGAFVIGWTLTRTVLREVADRHDMSGEGWAAVGAVVGGIVAALNPGLVFTFAFIGGCVGLIIPFVSGETQGLRS